MTSDFDWRRRLARRETRWSSSGESLILVAIGRPFLVGRYCNTQWLFAQRVPTKQAHFNPSPPMPPPKPPKLPPKPP